MTTNRGQKWEKGESGNPSGSRKDKIWADSLRLESHITIQDPDVEEVKEIKKIRLAARRLFDRAIDGDITAMKEIGDRLDGKAAQSLDISYKDKDISELTDDELSARIADTLARLEAAGLGENNKANGKEKPASVH